MQYEFFLQLLRISPYKFSACVCKLLQCNKLNGVDGDRLRSFYPSCTARCCTCANHISNAFFV